MRAKSARAARQHRERVAMLRRSHGPERCQWPRGCASEAVDAHEALSRARGGDPTNPDWLLCRRHHDDVTTATGAFLAWCIDQRLLASAAPRARSANVYEAGTVPSMPRRPISIRVSDTADDWIEAEAKRAGVSRAIVLRAMLSTATQHADEVRRRIALTKEA